MDTEHQLLAWRSSSNARFFLVIVFLSLQFLFDLAVVFYLVRL